MSLFIETPQQEQLRLLREQREQLKRLRNMSEGAGVVGSAEDTSQMDRSLLDQRLFAFAPAPNSAKPAGSFGKRVAEGFNEGLDASGKGGYPRSRIRSLRNRMPSSWSLTVDARDVAEGCGGAFSSCCGPGAHFAFCCFCGSYALTCILNGASPQELTLLMGELLPRCKRTAVWSSRCFPLMPGDTL